jgi:pSer/pThr/pTyr-binding forkhead associated (FHA) protein
VRRPARRWRISWRHLKVELVDGVPLITDLGSRNGSYLDGKRLTITSALIARETIVQIGGVRARIRETEPESVSTQGRFRATVHRV